MKDELVTPKYVKKWFLAVLVLGGLSLIPSLDTVLTFSVLASVLLVVWAYRWCLHHLPHHVGGGRSFSRLAVAFLVACFVASLYMVIIPVLYFPLLYLGHGINLFFGGGLCGGVLGQCELLYGTIVLGFFLIVGMWVPVKAMVKRFSEDIGTEYNYWLPLLYSVVLFVLLVFLPYAIVGLFGLI